MFGADKLVDTADRLGVIDAVKTKLVKQPDPAAAKLVTVLEELSKIYGQWRTNSRPTSHCSSTMPIQSSSHASEPPLRDSKEERFERAWRKPAGAARRSGTSTSVI